MPQTITKYGAEWPSDTLDVQIEMAAIRKGGRWRSKGVECGEGLFHHYKEFMRLLWPEKSWHRWNDLLLRTFCENRIIPVMGPASSGKTSEACDFGVATYFVFPNDTSVICSSTTLKSLERRIWGEVVKKHRQAQKRYPWLPGTLLDYKFTIVTEVKTSTGKNSRDYRNGIFGVPNKQGEKTTSMQEMVGIKNKRVMLIADELQFMQRGFVDAISNLGKNVGFKCIGLGNPKDRTDALGVLAEPSVEVGGWDALDATEKTKTWPTRIPGGTCVQLVGTDSPNFDVAEGEAPPFPFLISRESIKVDLAFYGRDSLQFSMMNLGMMPKDAQSRRVITRSLCAKFGAMEEPIWEGGERIRIYGLDAAYGSVGGDRCVGLVVEIGKDKDGKQIVAVTTQPYVIPVSAKLNELPEDQIALHVKERCAELLIQPQNVFFDGTGRASLMAAFARLWSSAVNPVEFGGKATERPLALNNQKTCRDHYGKFVSELWFSVRYAIESGQFRGLGEEALEEGCMREWIITPGNKVDVEPKDKMKERMGRSPDIFDALVTAIEGARRRGFNIDRIGGANSVRDMRWFQKLQEEQQRQREAEALTY